MSSIRAATASSHTADVASLRELVWKQSVSHGRIVAPEALALNKGDQVMSAFSVSGMDFGVPPVVAVGG